MTREEAYKYLMDISYVFGNTSIEYLNEKHGEKMREAVEVLKQQPCEDCISRQAAIEAIWDGINMDIYTREVKECLEALPSVTPQPKMGKWIKNEWGNISCSSCGCAALYDKVYPGESVFGKAIRVKSTFCPTCGAKM